MILDIRCCYSEASGFRWTCSKRQQICYPLLILEETSRGQYIALVLNRESISSLKGTVQHRRGVDVEAGEGSSHKNAHV